MELCYMLRYYNTIFYDMDYVNDDLLQSGYCDL